MTVNPYLEVYKNPDISVIPDDLKSKFKNGFNYEYCIKFCQKGIAIEESILLFDFGEDAVYINKYSHIVNAGFLASKKASDWYSNGFDIVHVEDYIKVNEVFMGTFSIVNTSVVNGIFKKKRSKKT